MDCLFLIFKGLELLFFIIRKLDSKWSVFFEFGCGNIFKGRVVLCEWVLVVIGLVNFLCFRFYKGSFLFRGKEGVVYQDIDLSVVFFYFVFGF